MVHVVDSDTVVPSVTSAVSESNRRNVTSSVAIASPNEYRQLSEASTPEKECVSLADDVSPPNLHR